MNNTNKQNGLTFLQTTIPTWRVVVMSKALNIRFENLEFYIGAKYGRLAVSKEDNYFFSISIVKEWKYDVIMLGKQETISGRALYSLVNELKKNAAKQFDKTKEQKLNETKVSLEEPTKISKLKNY